MADKEEGLISIIGSGCDITNRVLYVMGEIDIGTMYRFMVGLRALEEKEGDIRIVINSEGGLETAGYAIYDAIMASNNKVITEGWGQVSSISAIVFQAGDVRRLSIESEYMIHNGSIGINDTEQDRIIDLAEQLKRGNKRYHSILVNSSRLSFDEVEQYCRNEQVFSAKEALDCGLTDELINYVKQKRKPRKRSKR